MTVRSIDTAETVAAVCHQGDPNALQGDPNALKLLLVKTKSRKRWTFPKGHVKKKEAGWEAAAREAEEEAGVVRSRMAATREAKEEAGVVKGRITETPFISYRTKGAPLVFAYLLTVLQQREALEPWRTPTWVTTEKAVAMFAGGGREREYADEHARVVREAVAALRSGRTSAGHALVWRTYSRA